MDLDDDERSVVREALAYWAEGHEATLRQFAELDRPASPWHLRAARDAALARRLIREQFRPLPPGGAEVDRA